MCMGGGSSQGSVITMPDTGSYDRQFDRQLQMMQMAQSNELTDYQMQLEEAARKQQDLLTEFRNRREERADDVASVEAEARRMSNIIGTPPPDVSAKAPVIAEARKSNRKQKPKGKRGLRISRNVASSSGKGAGLQIL